MLVVIGAGGHGKVVVSTLQAAGRTVDAVYDDDSTKWEQRILGVPVRGPVASLPRNVQAVLGLGDNRTRERLAQTLSFEWISAIHPVAIIHPSVRIGQGTVVFAGSVIQPDAVLGNHVIVNTSASVDHDCNLADFASIGPGAHLAGTVRVGARSALGTGASVLPNIRIAEDVVVGAGTVVIRDVGVACTVVGPEPRILPR